MRGFPVHAGGWVEGEPFSLSRRQIGPVSDRSGTILGTPAQRHGAPCRHASRIEVESWNPCRLTNGGASINKNLGTQERPFRPRNGPNCFALNSVVGTAPSRPRNRTRGGVSVQQDLLALLWKGLPLSTGRPQRSPGQESEKPIPGTPCPPCSASRWHRSRPCARSSGPR